MNKTNPFSAREIIGMYQILSFYTHARARAHTQHTHTHTHTHVYVIKRIHYNFVA